MHHALDSIDEHSLHYISSLFTNECYWKDEGKYDTKTGVHRDWAQLLAYCGKDACVTRELTDELLEQLGQEGQSFYEDQSQALIDPILQIMLHGVRIDVEHMKKRQTELKTQALSLRDQITAANDGEPPFKLTTKRDRAIYDAKKVLHDTLILHKVKHIEACKSGCTKTDFLRKSKNKHYTAEEVQKSLDTIEAKSVSNQELMRILYEKFGLPKQTKLRKTTGQRTASVDAVSLRTLRLRHGNRNEQAAKIIDLAIDFAKVKKLSEFYDIKRVDEDERIRCSYKIGGTETRRLSSAKNPKGTGTNLQNPAREARDIFVPDYGCVFLEVDLSQAEDRVVKALAYSITGNKDLLERARAKPWENDEHKRAARSIYKVAIDRVTKDQRQHAKQVRHGLNYDMKGKTMSEGFLKEGIVYTPFECTHMIEALSQDDPEIREWQKWTRAKIIRERKLSNSWGATWEVPYERLDDNLYRRGYAFVPQSEVGILINAWGLIPLADHLKGPFPSQWADDWQKVKVNLQVHDSLVISCPPQLVWSLANILKHSLERPRSYNGVELVIPCEYAVGFNWNKVEMHEWKDLPSKSDMTEVAYAMSKKVVPF
jgi:DNA polymerase I-like protein with 3'-5' exonuclease and polymerase domains